MGWPDGLGIWEKMVRFGEFSYSILNFCFLKKDKVQILIQKCHSPIVPIHQLRNADAASKTSKYPSGYRLHFAGGDRKKVGVPIQKMFWS